jgi:3-methyladenine DNA glycosylase AlkD
MIQSIRQELRQQAVKSPEAHSIFFKTQKGGYAEHDAFLGIPVPAIRKIAKGYRDLGFKQILDFLSSRYNEERLFALIILTDQYQNSNNQDKIFTFYLEHKRFVNNWNLVDASAHLIVGAHLFQKDKSLLLELSDSNNLWDRRIAIVSTWYFIRQEKLDWTFKLAKKLLQDKEDLIHKATGWMLREAGKKDEEALKLFLDKQAPQMPRTMLRYAIEKFSDQDRRLYLDMQ